MRIEIVDYDSEWPIRFEDEAVRMRETLGDNVVSVEHIGSTSVPGLAAKPIIDICPVVSDMEKGQKCAELLDEAGYYRSDKDRGDAWLELGRVADDGQHFNVHVRPEGSDGVANYLLLRDYLRDHPRYRDEYARVKRAGAEKYPDDVGKYTREKSGIIETILEKALEEGYESEF